MVGLKKLLLGCHLAIFLLSGVVRAQSTEEKFKDLFITAGYATAFGAALGAAALGFQNHPEVHLNYIAIGASMGFIGGSILGTYIILSPGFVTLDTQNTNTVQLAENLNKGQLLIRPIFNAKSQRLSAIETGLKLAEF